MTLLAASRIMLLASRFILLASRVMLLASRVMLLASRVMLLEFVEKMLMQAESCSLNMLRRLKKMNQSHLKHLSHGTYMIDQLMAETVDEELRRLKIEAKKKLPLSSKNKLLKNHIIKKAINLSPPKNPSTPG